MIKLTIKVWLSELNQKRWLLLTKSYRKIQKKTKVEEGKKKLTECLKNARDQLTASREAKHNLEMDWSDKVIIFL